jgi:hypothetical protein
MLHIKTIPDYANFFEKLSNILPEDESIKDILHLLRNVESGCRCQRGNRYRFLKDKISSYLPNLNESTISELKSLFNTNDFKFEELIMY